MVMSVNSTSVFLGMQAQVGHMRTRGGGSIVNTASVAGLTAAPLMMAYVASKHYVVRDDQGCRAGGRLRRHPSECGSAHHHNTLMRADVPDKVKERLSSLHAIKRLVEVEEVAGVIVSSARTWHPGSPVSPYP
jgi:NADP-dependent 3-hydroxy acid dehydrogenase YdfG